jgi:hypothetical protein
MAKKPQLDAAAQAQALEQSQVEQAFLKGMTTLRDLIAPSSIENKRRQDSIYIWLSARNLYRLAQFTY